MISISAEFGGPELKGSAVWHAVMEASNAASEARRENYGNGTSAWINAIFVVPGSLTQPDFEGYKIGHFSAKRKGVVVVVAVPQSAACGDQVPHRIYALLHGAGECAANFFATKKIPFDRDECTRVLTAVAERLRVDPQNLWKPPQHKIGVLPGRPNVVRFARRRWAKYLVGSLLMICVIWAVVTVFLIGIRDYR